MTAVRKLSLITCKVCGVEALRGRPDAMYCIAHIPHNNTFKRATHCLRCFNPIEGRKHNALLCLGCAGKRRPGYRYRPKNANELARKVTNYAVKIGFLPAPSLFSCLDCKSRQAECYDHRDYSKPLEVEAVCLPCNSSRGKGKALYVVGANP